jgi:RNA polymerase sigma-70 factor (ECF subfamily)
MRIAVFVLESPDFLEQTSNNTGSGNVYGSGSDKRNRMNRSGAVREPQARERAMRMEAVMNEYEAALLRYAGRLVNNPVAAQDVVQNVFIKFYRGGYFESVEGSRLKAWLFRVTHNEAVDHVRREARLHRLHELHAEQTPHHAASGACDETSAAERHQLVLKCLDRMHPRERQVVLLRLEEGLSYREIAEVTGRTTGNVGYILFHAIRKLGEKLKLERGFVREPQPDFRQADVEET